MKTKNKPRTHRKCDDKYFDGLKEPFNNQQPSEITRQGEGGKALGNGKPKAIPSADKIQRQGLTVTINQLDKLMEELTNEFDDGTNCWSSDDDRTFQINIINKSGDSDGWKIE
ncbi:MAG: hypothetical protein ACTSU7_00030 [Candidatus Heimdallarchaeaceae archaeon]